MPTDLVVVFCISMLGAFFGQAVPGRSKNALGKLKPNILGFIIPTVVMILYSGLRKNIGDTVFYVHTYHLIEDGEFASPVWGQSAYLFQLFQHTLVKLGFDYSALIMLSAIAILLPAMWLLYKYSADFSLSVFLIFTMGIYVSTMNGIRQYIAAGIVILASRFLFSSKKSDFLKFLPFVLVAYLFHSSALLLIPIYFLCRRKAWSAPAMISVAAGVVGLIFISMFLPSFLSILEDTDYGNYADSWFTDGVATGASFLRVAFNCMPTVLAAIFSKQIRRFGPVTDILINISLVHSAIYILAVYNWIFARFAFYTCIYVVLLMAIIFHTVLRSGKYRFFAFMLFFSYFIFFLNDTAAQGVFWYSSDFFEPNNTKWFQFLYIF